MFTELDKYLKTKILKFFWGCIGLLIFFLELGNVLKAALGNVHVQNNLFVMRPGLESRHVPFFKMIFPS